MKLTQSIILQRCKELESQAKIKIGKRSPEKEDMHSTLTDLVFWSLFDESKYSSVDWETIDATVEFYLSNQ